MTSQKTPAPRVPRESLAARISSLKTSKAKSYAAFIQKGDQPGMTPCWDAIAARFVADFATDEERLAVLDKVIEEGDRRPLYLFLETSRARPKLLEALCARAGQLPVAVQRNLAAMPEAATQVAAHLDSFDPSAQAVWNGGEDTKRAERELLASRVGELTALSYFVPDAIDPAKEPPAAKPSVAPAEPTPNVTPRRGSGKSPR